MNRHIKRVIQLRLIITKHNYKCNESSCLLRGKIKKGNIISIEKFEHCTRREYLQDIMHAVRIDLAHEEEIFYRLASYYATMDFLLHYTGWHRDLSIQQSYHGRYHLNSREGFIVSERESGPLSDTYGTAALSFYGSCFLQASAHRSQTERVYHPRHQSTSIHLYQLSSGCAPKGIVRLHPD